jgi:long-subunit acyl-CoA synthetase (AMP-forming)
MPSCYICTYYGDLCIEILEVGRVHQCIQVVSVVFEHGYLFDYILSGAQIWVYGNSFESFPVAVVVPDRKALEEWATNNNQTGDLELLCENLKARKYVLDELNSTGQKNKLRGFEMLRAVHLEPNPFDIERDLVTPTFKLKRPQLLKYYKDCIDELYEEAKRRME